MCAIGASAGDAPFETFLEEVQAKETKLKKARAVMGKVSKKARASGTKDSVAWIEAKSKEIGEQLANGSCLRFTGMGQTARIG